MATAADDKKPADPAVPLEPIIIKKKVEGQAQKNAGDMKEIIKDAGKQ